MPTEAAQTVAAIIPQWNRRDLLQTLLDNLRAQVRPFDQVIVADNGSTDGSAELAENSGARVLRMGTNLGFAAAVNRGVEAARTDWVAILNNDVTLEPGWLAALLNAAQHEKAWFATGKILRAGDPGTLDGAFDEISRGACACRCGSGKPADGPLWNQARRIRFAPMTALLARRELFARVGPLDEGFGSYLEDVDFGIRCSLAGLEGIYVPDAVSHHQGSATTSKWNKDTIRSISRNQVLLAAKYLSKEERLPILAGQLLWGLLALRHGRGVAYLRGKILGLKAARQIRRKHEFPQAPYTVRTLFQASEQEILAVQRQAGSDWYWRTYFWLLRR